MWLVGINTETGHFHDHAKHGWKVLSERERKERKEKEKKEKFGEKSQIGFSEHSSLVHIPASVHPGMEINVCIFAHSNGRGEFSSLRESVPEDFFVCKFCKFSLAQ